MHQRLSLLVSSIPAPNVAIMIYISPTNATSLANQMHSELTNRVDLSSNSYQNPTVGLDGQRVIGSGFAAGSISDGQAYKSNERIFVVCDACFWATTYLDKSRLPVLDSRCSRCQEVELSSFPILANESFTYTHSEKRGLELIFTSRKD
jgi:hypothetical protein